MYNKNFYIFNKEMFNLQLKTQNQNHLNCLTYHKSNNLSVYNNENHSSKKKSLHEHGKVPSFKKGDLISFQTSFWKTGNELDKSQTNPSNEILGLCMRRKNNGFYSSFTIKHFVNKIWTVETFPVYSPFIRNIKIRNK